LECLNATGEQAQQKGSPVTFANDIQVENKNREKSVQNLSYSNVLCYLK